MFLDYVMPFDVKSELPHQTKKLTYPQNFMLLLCIVAHKAPLTERLSRIYAVYEEEAI